MLLVANDAALSGQYGRAEELLTKQSTPRTIATAYKTVTEESSADGDFADRGWEDKAGDPIEVDASDIEEQVETGSHAPVTDAIVEKAVRWLRDHDASRASSSSFTPGDWYSTEFTVSNYGSGEERSEDFFLRNFTEEEERRVFKEFHSDRRR